jgi:hypothetical protein
MALRSAAALRCAAASHFHQLGVPADWFIGMLVCVCDACP